MSCRNLTPVLVAVTLVLAQPVLAQKPKSTVKLPLEDYKALVSRADQAQRARAVPREAPVAELQSQKTTVTLDGDEAQAVTVYEVELRGKPTGPVELPVLGFAESLTVEPSRGAALDPLGEGVALVAPEPGSYKVTVASRAALLGSGGVRSLRLAPNAAPVATLDLTLDAELEWTVQEATVVADEVQDGRRRLRLAPGRGQRPWIEIRRTAAGDTADLLLGRSTLVTVVEAGTNVLRRHDVVAYEVLRGSLAAFEVDLPAGLELEEASTDEGKATPVLDQRRLRVDRGKLLTGAGHLALSFRPFALDAEQPETRLPLPAVSPAVEGRDRFLVSVPAVDAVVRPLPENAWRRADASDLPPGLRDKVAAIRPTAVWRQTDSAADASLAVVSLPAAQRVGGVAWQRTTTTLLTVDGSLVHQDRIVLREAGTALAVTLGEGATLWSALVDGVAVRPIERVGAFLVPLAFHGGGETVVELVAVAERVVERGRSTLSLTAPRLELPVLSHEWCLLLPEKNRYRFAAGDLGPAPPKAPAAHARYRLGADQSTPSGAVFGTVTFEDGHPLPGATVSLVDLDLVAFSDAEGHFWFEGLPPGRYRLLVELDGFSSVEHPDVRVVGGRTTGVDIDLSPTVQETITVPREGTFLDVGEVDKIRNESEDREMKESFGDALAGLKSGLVEGVKPLAVEVPETGKVLTLAGVLPPPLVTVEIEVKAR